MWSGGFALISALLSLYIALSSPYICFTLALYLLCFRFISALLSLYIALSSPYICFEFAFPLGVSPSFTFLPFYFFTFNPYFTITCIDPVSLREMPSGPTAVMLAM